MWKVEPTGSAERLADASRRKDVMATPRLLSRAAGRIDLPFTEIRKTA